MKYVISFVGNFIWKLFGGVWLATFWFLLGVILTLTIIGYPLAVNCFRIGWLCFKPTNKRVGVYFERYLSLNLLWIVFAGWMVIPYAVVSITLISLKCLKLTKCVQEVIISRSEIRM